MDAMAAMEHNGLQFLCIGENLPSGAYHAVVLYKASPDKPIQTLVVDSLPYSCSTQALVRAKELAITWAMTRPIAGY